MPDSLRPHGLQLTRLLCPRDFPGNDTGMGCHFLLQGIFPTQGLNLGLLHCRQILYQLSYKGNPKVKMKVAQAYLTLCNPMDYTVHGILQTRILERVAFPFSRGSSQPTSPELQAGSLPAEPQLDFYLTFQHLLILSLIDMP